MPEQSIAQLNAKMQSLGLAPNLIVYRTDLKSLEEIFVKLIEEKTSVKDVQLIFSADCEMDTLHTELDDTMPEEKIEKLATHGIRDMEGHTNTLLLLEWLTGISASRVGAISSAYLYEDRDEHEQVDILVPMSHIYTDVEKKVDDYLQFNGITLTDKKREEIIEHLEKFREADEETFSCELICEVSSAADAEDEEDKELFVLTTSYHYVTVPGNTTEEQARKIADEIVEKQYEQKHVSQAELTNWELRDVE